MKPIDRTNVEKERKPLAIDDLQILTVQNRNPRSMALGELFHLFFKFGTEDRKSVV